MPHEIPSWIHYWASNLWVSIREVESNQMYGNNICTVFFAWPWISTFFRKNHELIAGWTQNDGRKFASWETSLILSAAPPLESPSSFVSIAPVIPISTLKVLTNADHIRKAIRVSNSIEQMMKSLRFDFIRMVCPSIYREHLVFPLLWREHKKLGKTLISLVHYCGQKMPNTCS